MSNETRPEQHTPPAEVMNAELAARLEFTEKRLMAMATVAYNLQLKCGELTMALSERSQEITVLQAALGVNGDGKNTEEEGA
ncbi:hypothetical protein [Rhizobium rhizogenes]|uniref:hypothetical protein n=1 Tax=Rhizobium rhizogenes TaxID=359 RepID=UPI001571E86D|nr:hypothetical protein [Rhizobium rhizogenes]MDJ1632239.1 hypothetical protein [Rhizobium rhizogenes]NTG07162.1 hypothetical protein [Rhizobium rhizogenes]